MSNCIRMLPDSVANQIAAGEVVNRPSSAVKEMLENAVDAGAKNITVNFRDGGKALIQVIDDGSGMSPADARLAFDRHATSKISDVNDIYGLSTFGFRGEALASIASVAEVELSTRQRGEELGTRVSINGGNFVSQQRVACPEGSQFVVKNLFYNVPARRRFLEKSTTEARHITAEYQRVALCNPQLAFSLYDNDALVSKLAPSSLRQRIVGVIGKNIARNLLELSADTSIVKIDGFVGHPSGVKQSNKEQFLFVNGRYFRSPYFHKAVVGAYDKLIPPNSQPSYFVYLTIDPQRIDVNVHPQKTEVKFEDGPEIWHIINAAVRESLAKSGAVPSMDFDMDTSIEIPVYRNDRTVLREPTIKGNPDFNPFRESDDDTPRNFSSAADRRIEYDFDQTENGMDISDVRSELYDESVLEYISGEDAVQQTMMDGADESAGAILAAGTKYAVTARDGAIMVTDLRRAWESVLYDRYLMMMENGSSVCQQLLFPETVTMSIDDISAMRENLTQFTDFGFDIKFGDEHSIEIHGIPADFISEKAETLLYDLLDAVRDQSEKAAEVKKKKAAELLARSGSFHRSKKLGREELSALMESLAECSNPSFTPSGLPVTISIGEEELAARFKK